MLTFTVFEIESSHYPNDETCNSKIQANHTWRHNSISCYNNTELLKEDLQSLRELATKGGRDHATWEIPFWVLCTQLLYIRTAQFSIETFWNNHNRYAMLTPTTDFRRLRRLDVSGAVWWLRDVNHSAFASDLFLRQRRLHQAVSPPSSCELPSGAFWRIILRLSSFRSTLVTFSQSLFRFMG